MSGPVPVEAPRRLHDATIDGEQVRVAEGMTILDACRAQGMDVPTMCYLETLTPVNACRVCVVEVEGSRALVPAYGADPDRYGPPEEAAGAGERDRREPGHHHPPGGETAATVHQPVKVDNDLYVRDYSRCILCYKCVEACGVDAQNTFAIAVAGRGFDARISTEYAVPLTDSACVYCGNCIGVCPTGALAFKSEYDMRQEGTWDESRQTVTETICPYCGVGCSLELHVQDDEIVKVTSPLDHDITRGHLCIKGRFGFQFVQNRPPPD